MKPLRYIDRTWLRRLTLIPIALACLLLYLGAAVGQWWRDFYDVWR